MRLRARFETSVLLAGAIFVGGHVARADDGASVIFDRAVKAHDAGKCETSPVGDETLCSRAAADFTTVYAMNPQALGALRNLAYTERGLGRVASAARHFRELAAKAPSDPKPERRAWAKFAGDEAEALAPRVPHIVIAFPAHAPPGAVVRLDDQQLAPGSVGMSLDLDPGAHRVHAEAPGFQPFDALVQLDERDRKTVTLNMKPVEGGPAAISPAPPVVTTPPAPPPKAETPPPRQERHSHTAPVVIGIAGAGLTVLGLALGGAALVERNGNCDTQKLCDPDSLQTAHDLADASTVVVIVGAAALATGVVWYLATPSDTTSSSAALVISPRSAMAVVRF